MTVGGEVLRILFFCWFIFFHFELCLFQVTHIKNTITWPACAGYIQIIIFQWKGQKSWPGFADLPFWLLISEATALPISSHLWLPVHLPSWDSLPLLLPHRTRFFLLCSTHNNGQSFSQWQGADVFLSPHQRLFCSLLSQAWRSPETHKRVPKLSPYYSDYIYLDNKAFLKYLLLHCIHMQKSLFSDKLQFRSGCSSCQEIPSGAGVLANWGTLFLQTYLQFQIQCWNPYWDQMSINL